MLGLQEQYSPWDLPSRWFLVFLVGNPLLLGIYIKGIVFICFGFLEQIRVNPSFKESINVVLHRLFSYVIGIHIYQWQSMPSACFASLGWQAELRLHVSYVYQTNVGHSWVKCYVWNLPQRNQGFYQLNMQALIDIYIYMLFTSDQFWRLLVSNMCCFLSDTGWGSNFVSSMFGDWSD